MTTTTIKKIPSWALNYLVNGDRDGITDEEYAMIDKWLVDAKCLLVCSPHESDHPYFSHEPAFGLACEVYDCECLIVNMEG